MSERLIIKRHEFFSGREYWLEYKLHFQFLLWGLVTWRRIQVGDTIEYVQPKTEIILMSGVGWFPLEMR